MEFKMKAALAEWANDQTMPEIAAYYNGLPGVKPVKEFEVRDVAVTRIWAVLSPESGRRQAHGCSETQGGQLVRSSVWMRRSPEFKLQLIQDCRAQISNLLNADLRHDCGVIHHSNPKSAGSTI